MKYIAHVIISCVFLNSSVFAWENNEQNFCLQSCPTSMSSENILVQHDILLLSNNIHTKFSDWVAYKVHSDNLSGGKRSRNR